MFIWTHKNYKVVNIKIRLYTQIIALKWGYNSIYYITKMKNYVDAPTYHIIWKYISIVSTRIFILADG